MVSGRRSLKTYIPKANRTLAEQLALKKVSAAAGTNSLAGAGSNHCLFQILPAGSLSSDDPHLLSDPACEDLLHSYFSTSKKYSGRLECFRYLGYFD